MRAAGAASRSPTLCSRVCLSRDRTPVPRQLVALPPEPPDRPDGRPQRYHPNDHEPRDQFERLIHELIHHPDELVMKCREASRSTGHATVPASNAVQSAAPSGRANICQAHGSHLSCPVRSWYSETGQAVHCLLPF